MNKCINGKCDFRNQTSEDVIEFIGSEDKIGFSFLLFVDKNQERGFRKDIIKDVSYKEISLLVDKHNDLRSWKFIPYTYNLKLDEVVENMVDGDFNSQLKK